MSFGDRDAVVPVEHARALHDALRSKGRPSQYHCYFPMEVHTARWMGALRDLFLATGDESYRTKAGRAANAIVRGQWPDGRFSTWGRDAQMGVPALPAGDWYGCNAIAATQLMMMAPGQAGPALPLPHRTSS